MLLLLTLLEDVLFFDSEIHSTQTGEHDRLIGQFAEISLRLAPGLASVELHGRADGRGEAM